MVGLAFNSLKLNFMHLKSLKCIIITFKKFIVDILIRLLETVNKFDSTRSMTDVVNVVQDFPHSLFPVGHPFEFITFVSKKNFLLDEVVSDGGSIDSSHQRFVCLNSFLGKSARLRL